MSTAAPSPIAPSRAARGCGARTISFDLPGSDALQGSNGPLPARSKPSTIDGTSQPGSPAGEPDVEIDGQAHPHDCRPARRWRQQRHQGAANGRLPCYAFTYRGRPDRGMISFFMKVDKLSVSFDADLGDAVRDAAKRAGRGLSGWLAEAAQAKLRSEALEDFLDGWEAEHGTLSSGQLAAAAAELHLDTASAPPSV